EAGFVRTAAGATFPRHRHLGSEITLVLEGGLWDNGRHYLPREIIEKDTDSVHEYRADPERDLITVVVYHGIEIL
ncbi:MAG: cupin domain-containing protein, partial [Nitrospirae bacterium]|nr:cupin domain-containing protein [Candidatus Troglogloeales bacterium]